VNVAPQTNHLGRSKFVSDPFFNGQFASFRAYGRALSPQEITAPLPNIEQPTSGGWWPGQTLSFSGNATDFSDLPVAATNLSWQIKYAQDGATNVVFGPSTGISSGPFTVPATNGGNGNYIATLTATDSANRQASTSVTLAAANRDPGWASYYPLRTDAADVFGHFSGNLNGGASFVNDAVRGNVLNLSGVNQFVSLPRGASAIQTFMGWVMWNGGAAWQRIFDFGNDTNRYTVLTPAAADGKLRFNISVNSIAGEQVAEAPGGLPVGVWTHVAVVLNGASALVYTNGALAGSNNFANLVPAELKATNNFLGKSNWPDPYFNGRLSSIRLFSRPLAAWEISAPQVDISGPSQGAVYSPGDTINFSGTANDFNDLSIGSTGLVWTIWFINGAATNLVLGPVSDSSGSFNVPASGASATNGSYRLVLVATDTAGRSASNSVTVFPIPLATAGRWSAFYPFDSGAQDASNHYNGLLLGGASTQVDPAEGTVLNLLGAAQYASFPATVASAQTFCGWVKWRDGTAWQRVFDFGRDTQHYFFLSPRDATGMIQCAITPDASTYNQVIESQIPFPTNQWSHVALTMDGQQGVLYLNGNAIAVNNSVNLLPSDLLPTKAFIGRSEFASDPYLNAQLDSVYLNSSALSSLQIMQSFLQPQLRVTAANGVKVISWPAWASPMRLYSVTNLTSATWVAVTNVPVNSGSNVSVTLPANSPNTFFRLQWP
jgi:concanavalin A-like lectin/glucanase superfamily protein